MLIWVVAIVLFVLFGALGYAKGAVRMIFPLVGLFLGAFLALPLAPVVRPLVPLVGMTNPIWSVLLPPVIVFLLIGLVFIGVGFFGHARVDLLFKYRGDEYQQASWRRLNQRVGVVIGFAAGAVYTVLLSLIVYVLGYMTVQVSAGDNDPAPVRYLNQARADLTASGLDRVAAALDPAPAVYYNAADVLGLLYQNPPLHSRLAAYPPLVGLAERQELQDVATDTEFQNMLASQPSVMQVIDHPKTQAILANAEVLQQLKELDLQDLRDYLKTGISEKYRDQPLLGRWELDPYLTLTQEKKRKTGMTSAEVKLLRYQMEFVKGFRLFVAPDNTVKLKGPDISQMIGKLQELAKAVSEGNKPRPIPQVVVAQQPQPEQAERSPAMSSVMAQRYGLRNNRGVPTSPGAAAQPPTAVVAPVTAAAAAPKPMTTTELAAEIAKLPVVVLAQGSWKEEGGKFVLQLQAQNEIPQFLGTRKSSTIDATVRDDRLYLNENKQGLVLARF